LLKYSGLLLTFKVDYKLRCHTKLNAVIDHNKLLRNWYGIMLRLVRCLVA